MGTSIHCRIMISNRGLSEASREVSSPRKYRKEATPMNMTSRIYPVG